MQGGSYISFKEMCARFQVTPRTLRYYEYIELLSPRREGRARWYGPREIARMTLIMRGRRFGNLVAVASDAVLPLAELTRACARDPMPSRVVDGADLERFVGRSLPVTDADAQPSPEPPAGVFAR